MRYLIDIHHKPPMVVLATEDVSELQAVGQRYADQVARPLVVAVGPHPEDATYRPTIPSFEAPPEPGVTGVGVLELPAPAPAAPELAEMPGLREGISAALAKLGLKL